MHPGEQRAVGRAVKLKEASAGVSESSRVDLERICGQYWNTLLGDYYAGAGLPLNNKHDPINFGPNMMFLGRVDRYVPYKDRRLTDPYVSEALREANITFEEKYRMCNPHTEAMTVSIAKYNRGQPVLDDSLWTVAGDWTERHFSPYLADSVVLPLFKCMREADRQTSAGYPWSRFFKNKGEFMDSAEFERVIDTYWTKLGTEDPFISLWTASLKRELRPVEKKTQRTFTASSTEGSISANRLCLDMNEKFYASNNKTWSFVGCSKFNLGFNRLYHRLNVHPNAYALDETAYDASLFRDAMFGQRDLRWNMMHSHHKTPENKVRLWNIYDQIVNSCIVLDDGQVYQKNTGNPSGSANTIVDNTMILFRLLAYAWLVCCKNSRQLNDFGSYAAFMKNVEGALNGDDNTLTISNSVHEFFNGEKIAAVWSSIGITTKSSSGDWKARKLEQVDFLSHDFVNIDDIWLPKPEREKVLASALYGNECLDVRFTLLRLYALRIESWPCVQTRSDLRVIINSIRKKYTMELQGVITGTQLTMKDVEAVYKTDAEIWRLYAYPQLEPGWTSTLKKMSVGESLLSGGPCYGGSRTFANCLNGYAQSGVTSIKKCDEKRVSAPHISPKLVTVSKGQISSFELYGKRIPPLKFVQGKVDKQIVVMGRAESRSLCLYEWSHLSGYGNPSCHDVKVNYAVEMPSKANGRRNPKTGKHKNMKKMKPKKGKKKGKGDSRTRDRQDRAPVSSSRVMTNRQSRSTRITHRESLGPVIPTGTSFQTVIGPLAVNPGQAGSFPWLSNIAQQYETYAPKRRAKMHAIRYVYESRCSTATAGTVCMVTNYDSAESAFTSLAQAENYRGSTCLQPWAIKPVAHELEVDSMRDYARHYVRPGAAAANTDIKTYDVGNFSLICSGCPNTQIGELFVEYDLDFFDPRVTVPVGANLPMAHIVSGASSATAAAPLTGGSIREGSNLPGLTFTNTTITIPNVGGYVAAFGIVGTAITQSPGIASSTNTVGVNLLDNDGAALLSGFILNQQGACFFVFDVTAPNGVITLNGCAGLTGGQADVIIMQVSSGLTRPKSELESKMAKLDSLLALFGERKTLGKDEKSEALPPLSIDSKGYEMVLDRPVAGAVASVVAVTSAPAAASLSYMGAVKRALGK